MQLISTYAAFFQLLTWESPWRLIVLCKCFHYMTRHRWSWAFKCSISTHLSIWSVGVRFTLPWGSGSKLMRVCKLRNQPGSFMEVSVPTKLILFSFSNVLVYAIPFLILFIFMNQKLLVGFFINEFVSYVPAWNAKNLPALPSIWNIGSPRADNYCRFRKCSKL